ncbi:hypothetical protein TVAG_011290 [Trichomonas vaginalis G3]|uniref:Choline transporter-like protein n=1 Tax=Trichomonas vaginalis (strain ATCC PRA-98 / G3) TaxID=412133 RepID=A2FDN6_TRIV3|nr:choline transmembrane transporter protein [Trichomonas vaginalis G3]EAX96980.1 hypothetical protein TVAG_011290 [Trichomonas vaginalis G3]KAI5524905.1 choline transmembrane transporter protein [Trichomonas vaginalis G3]|eukprot:XP_001309910.1 hypothetical protein [Trichomonas vaginalis G3]
MDLASSFSETIKQRLDYFPKPDGTIDYILNIKSTILICGASSVIVCFVCILILKNFASCIGKTVVMLVPLSLIGVCVFIFTSGSLVETILNREDIISQATLQIIAVIALVIAALIIWFLIRIWSKVNLALSHIEFACKVFYNNLAKFIFIRIIWLFIFILIGSIVLVSSAALYSIYEFKYNIPDDGFFKGIGRITFDWNIVFFMLIYNIVFLVFIHYLLIHLCHYVTSAAIVKWYFTERKGNSHFGRISFHGIWFAWKKGLGTVTISCLIRTTLMILVRQLANYLNKLPLTGIPFINTFINMLFRLSNLIAFVLASTYTTQHIFNTPWIPSAKLEIGFIAIDKLFTIIFMVIVVIIDWVALIGNFSMYVILFVLIDQIMGEGFNLFNPSLVLAALYGIIFLHVFRSIIDIIYVCQQSEKSLPENTAGDVSKMEKQIITETKDAPENADTNNQASVEKLEDKSEIKEE